MQSDRQIKKRDINSKLNDQAKKPRHWQESVENPPGAVD
jgi:hypothetical protein